jgi:hypothetical protein
MSGVDRADDFWKAGRELLADSFNEYTREALPGEEAVRRPKGVSTTPTDEAARPRGAIRRRPHRLLGGSPP